MAGTPRRPKSLGVDSAIYQDLLESIDEADVVNGGAKLVHPGGAKTRPLNVMRESDPISLDTELA